MSVTQATSGCSIVNLRSRLFGATWLKREVLPKAFVVSGVEPLLRPWLLGNGRLRVDNPQDPDLQIFTCKRFVKPFILCWVGV